MAPNKLRYYTSSVSTIFGRGFSAGRTTEKERFSSETLVLEGNRYFAKSILSSIPSETAPHEIIFLLPVFKRQRLVDVPLALFLFTPSFSKWLEDENSFLPLALSHMFPQEAQAQKMDAIVAIVDRLPAPSTAELTTTDPSIRHTHMWDSRNSYEGVALYVGNSSLSAPDLWLPRHAELKPSTMSLPGTSTLTFMFHSNQTETKSPGLNEIPNGFDKTYEWSRGKSFTSRTVELPLANTTFQNGRTSTLLASRWERSNDSKGIVQTMCQEIKHQLIKIPWMDKSASIQGEFHISVPLVELTVPRKIVAAMGNIVRQLDAGTGGDETIPASRELEVSVSEFREREKSAPPQIMAWALVTPKDRWTSLPTIREHKLSVLIHRGARLHRVLSGGGGWGKRQGLLSLDPDTSFTARNASSSSLSISGDSPDLELESVLGDVVKPGDVIQFFTYRPQEPYGLRPGKTAAFATGEVYNHVFEQLFSTVPVSQLSRVRSIEFGTIPTTMDSIPGVASPVSKELKGQKLATIANHFGALSEQGIGLNVSTHEFASVRQSGTVVQTKLDSPYSRCIYQRIKLEDPKIYLSRRWKVEKPFRTIRRLPSRSIRVGSSEL
ncbi:MAG: hypothetical protein M1827_004113 [Pycnora praestabilis]|nr:MAG: hypothetical protein M1827_004113 [Pycnora praestabilis]